MKRFSVMVMVAITLIFATGCSAPKYYVSVQTTINETEQFNDVGLVSSNSNFDKNITILPAQYPTYSKSVMNSGERNFFNNSLDSCLNMYYDKEYIIHPSNYALNIINENNLTEEYSTLVNDYRNTSILSKTKVEKISNILQSRYMLYTEFINQDDKITMSQGTMYGTTQIDIPAKDVIMSYQLWDTKYSKPIFETIISTGTLTENIDNGKISYNMLVAENITAFAKEIKNKNGQSVCPDCPKSQKEYNQKVKSAEASNSLLGYTLGFIIGFALVMLLIPKKQY